MGAELDLDDVAATSPLAQRELAELRADLAHARADIERLSVDLAEAQREIERQRFSVEWTRSRLDRLQKEQARIPDPWRTLVCDILANGSLLPDPEGKRYGP